VGEGQLLEYFFELNKIKDVKRYKLHHKVFCESVADHCFSMILIAMKFMDEMKLDLDFKKVVKLIAHHDICELGLEEDFDAVRAKNNKEYALEKKAYEDKRIKELSAMYGDEVFELFDEYEKQQTREAKFVKALDKLETNIHEMARGAEFFDDAEFVAFYPKKAVEAFPELVPFYKELLEHMKAEYIRVGHPWRREYEQLKGGEE